MTTAGRPGHGKCWSLTERLGRPVGVILAAAQRHKSGAHA